MIRTLVWKEYREMRSIAIAMAVFAVALIVCAQTLGEPQTVVVNAANFAIISVCLIWMVGLVAGAQPIAGERENGTLDWLDSQPVLRRAVGRAKISVAAGTVVLIGFLLIVIGHAAGWTAVVNYSDLVLGMVVCGLGGLGCGLMGSAFAGSALAAVGLGLALQVVSAGVWLALAFGLAPILDRIAGPHVNRYLISAVLVVPWPIVIAARRFNRLDRLRGPAHRRSDREVGGWRSLLWLSWRQSRVVALILAAAGLIAAVFWPIAWWPPYWPALGMAFGIIAGAGAFAADRPGEAYRFLGDRRVPLGQLWLLKSGMRLAALTIPIVLQLLLGWIYVQIDQLKHLSGSDAYSKFWLAMAVDTLLLAPLYGFALGQLLGMICRKGMVAVVLAAMFGLVVLVAWWPSIFMRGLHVWQWILPPLVLMATTRGAMRAWATGRLRDWRPMSAMIGGSAAAVILTGAGLWSRVAEAPFKGDPFDVAAFEASFPTPEGNKAGRMLVPLLAKVPERVFAAGPATDPQSGLQRRAFSAVQQAKWPLDDIELNRRLDELAAEPWFGEIRETVALPVGVLDTGVNRDPMLFVKAGTVGAIFHMRALQLIAREQLAEALEILKANLALGRQVRNKSGAFAFGIAAGVEDQALAGILPWVEAAGGKPDLIEQAIGELRAHARAVPPISDTIKHGYLDAVRAAAELPATHPGPPDTSLMRLLYKAPWEQRRLMGIVAAIYAGYLLTAELPLEEATRRIRSGQMATGERNYPLSVWTPPAADDATARADYYNLHRLIQNSIAWEFGRGIQVHPHIFSVDIAGRTNRRAAILQLGLGLFQNRTGRPATVLSDLVPQIIPELPLDPYTDKPFGYRVSQGEEIPWSSPLPDGTMSLRAVGAGQGVIWSVGADFQDGGGMKQARAVWSWPPSAVEGGYDVGYDVIYLAPMVKKP